MRAKVLIATNTTWNLVNFRSNLIRALLDLGCEVVAVAPPDEYSERLSRIGCRYLPLQMDNSGIHPGRDLLLLWRFYRVFRCERPDVYLGYTIKPNVYGSLAAHALGITVINNIAGLGAVFIRGGWLSLLVRGLYRVSLSQSKKVFFQNEDDRNLFVSGQLVNSAMTDQIPGSGVDLQKFSLFSFSGRSTIRFLLIARMLWDKGVAEFVEAARILKSRGVDAEFCLIGFLGVKNPAAISRKQMEEWVAEGFVQYLGETDDIRPFIVEADCVVLPSYREGVPRSLLEAAAMGRPIVTTAVVGCREVVDDGVNGYVCRARDAADLAEKLMRVVALTPEERIAMGLRGRARVETLFDERIVIKKYLETIDEVLRG